MKMDFKIRIAQQSDSAELRDLYKNTVLVVNRRDYSQDEVEDWASCGDDLSNIEEMIKTHYFIVAVNQLSQIVGFSSITPQGYLHSMFIRDKTISWLYSCLWCVLRWLKYGQDFIENQKFLKQVGEMEFLRFYNEKVTD